MNNEPQFYANNSDYYIIWTYVKTFFRWVISGHLQHKKVDLPYPMYNKRVIQPGFLSTVEPRYNANVGDRSELAL